MPMRTFALRAALAGLALLAHCGLARAADPAFPFGSHRQAYDKAAIRPSIPQKKLDRQTAAAYDAWKSAYLVEGCKPGHAYIKADTFTGAMVVSEGQGYGMLIVAMMAGHDPEAQRLFDALLRYALDHPSGIDGALMSWAQGTACENIMSNDSAADGDLDIAYALLIADKQWGSGGEFDYLKAAKTVMAGIRRSTVNKATKLTTLGDWVTVGSAKYKFATRSSDWMVGHFRAFAEVKRKDWAPVLDAHLTVIEQMQNDYAKKTGLLPDFVTETDTRPRPAPSGFLEAQTDGWYSYNACRDPWRIGIDAAISGDKRSTRAARRLSEWSRAKAKLKPQNLRDGYRLDGRPTVDYVTMSFIPPFAVAAMSDPKGRKWLDALWVAMADAEPQGYYPDSIKVLSMLAVSRNWLTP